MRILRHVRESFEAAINSSLGGETVMTYVGIFIAGIALATGVIAQVPKGSTGAAVLQGTWLVTSLNGQSMPEGSPPVTLTVAGDKYYQTVGGDVNERGT